MKRRFHSPQPNVPGQGIVAGYSMTFWALVVAIGVAAGIVGAVLMTLLHTIQHLAWDYHSGGFLAAVRRGSDARRVAILVLAGVVAGVGALALRWIRGVGGQEVSEALWLRDSRLDLGSGAARSVVSIAIVGLGASLGREAAPQLSSAAVASRLCDRAGVPEWQRRLLVACGAGAGMAAVYNVPLGGALFALEVLLGTVTLPLVLPALSATTIATVVAWVALPNRSIYLIPDYPISASLLAWGVVVAPFAGLAAAGWARLVGIAHDLKPDAGWRRLLRPILVLGGLGVVAIPYPQLLGNGLDPVQLALTGRLALGLLIILALLKPLVTAGCLGAGAPGGLFTPTLAFGVLLAGALGHVWTLIWPGPAAGAVALVGGSAVLGAATQGPLMAVVVMLELVNHSSSLIAPTLIATAGATVMARWLGAPSIYSARLGRSGRHLVRAGQGRDLVPNPFEPLSVGDRPADHG